MSLIEGKRITFKRARPNPLFQDWLEELYEEAKQKKSKFESTLKEALTSISKYPLPLQSGAECAILKGFDKRLCLLLDKRLEAYKCFINYVNPSSIHPIKDSSPSEQYCTTTAVNLSQGTENNAQIPLIEDNLNNVIQKARKDCKYKPTFRSGGYAILMALLDQRTHSSQEMLNKDELIDRAQKYCEESFIRPKPGTRYTAWSNMRRLIVKGFVKKTGSKKPQYSLTESGIAIASELVIDMKNKPSVNDIIFNDLQNDALTSPYIEPEVILIEECNSKSTLSKNNPQIKAFVGDLKTENNLNHELIVMEAGSFDIILLIDKNETSGVSKRNDPTVAQFNKFPDLKHEYRSLKVGDFTWVARHRTTGQELVLPYVVERKRMDDLGASIKDGRFHEQKFRLRKCGLNNVIYMVENYGSNKHVGLPVQTLMQALANTRMQDGFKVHVTESLTHSARFLAMMTVRLTYEFKEKTLKGHNKETRDNILMTFEYFNKSSLKNKPLSVTDTFIKILLQLKGVSVEKALAITNLYKTPKSLINAYKFCAQKDGEMLLANLKAGEMSRNVGPTVSKIVYQLFTFKNFS
ncbi:unnamed protein product [Euphydryas editha]|uniref:Crossover junction endonuclease MUS81 n=1 Tax=Euphydryas editha TaxID=104508 RepID=A0AAU9TGE2_EUPED|nr:unnamed protein product [Euphydryas editha]